ncbi:MAG: hypothetical protein Q7T36_15790 [Fluviicoccus sp.]|uniref:hypothetical protein n=1 Tax=Fluviicoccus sp. TaxID=2003552 RepID=UPI002721124C|nr:hypothetical protein [Fluviicoccus sp.]MDO8331927.1 hypothetical protein [Fluviicoccus sp.]
MSYFAYDRMGASIHAPSEKIMRELLESVSGSDPEHPDVSLNDAEGWSLSYGSSRRMSFENVETGEGPWHLKEISHAQAIELWLLLSQGNIGQLQANPWLPGYCS